MPIEFLPTNQIVIHYLINDRINIIDESTEKFVLSTYFRIFLNREFAESIPSARLEIWLLQFINLVEKMNSNELSEEAFEKIIKKCLILMLRETYLENLKSLTQKVLESINKFNPRNKSKIGSKSSLWRNLTTRRVQIASNR